MHVLAGFESQIRARSAVIAVVDGARKRDVAIVGVALARLDSERAIHVDPIRGFSMPDHVLQTLDDLVADDGTAARLEPGETVMVVAIDVPSEDDIVTVFDSAFVSRLEARWFAVKPKTTPGR